MILTSKTGVRHKRFNLAAAVAGAPLIDLNAGLPVIEFRHFEKTTAAYPVYTTLADGSLWAYQANGMGLFDVGGIGLAVQEVTRWVPVRIHADGSFSVTGIPKPTKADAERAYPGAHQYVPVTVEV